MAKQPRIVLIHATRVAIDPIETAFAALWPEAGTLSILEEGLSADLASGFATQAELDRRIVSLADYAGGLSPDAILFTCSAFGSGIEEAARKNSIPVLKPNEAMFEAAIGAGGRVAMLYTFPPSAKGMEREFRQEAARRGTASDIRPVFVPDALDALKAGDTATHDRLVSEAAARIGETEAEAVMLAHFSMTRAANMVRGSTRLPVFTSPETAISKLRRCLEAPRNREVTLEC